MRTLIIVIAALALSACMRDEALNLSYESYEPRAINDGIFISSPQEEGIDPDKPNQDWKLRVWHKRYKGSNGRKLSDADRKKRRKIIEHARKFKQNAKDGKEDLA